MGKKGLYTSTLLSIYITIIETLRHNLTWYQPFFIQFLLYSLQILGPYSFYVDIKTFTGRESLKLDTKQEWSKWNVIPTSSLRWWCWYECDRLQRLIECDNRCLWPMSVKLYSSSFYEKPFQFRFCLFAIRFRNSL